MTTPMEHLTAVLDASEPAYRAGGLAAAAGALCKVLNVYALHGFAVFDLLLATARGARLVARNYAHPLRRAPVDVADELQKALDEARAQAPGGAADAALDFAPALSHALLAHNRLRAGAPAVRRHKLVLVAASRAAGSNRLLRAAYALFKQGAVVHLYHAGAGPCDGQLADVARRTGGTVYVPQARDDAPVCQALNLLVNSVHQFHAALEEPAYWREAAQPKLQATKVLACVACGREAQRPEACRHCLLVYCAGCREGRCRCGAARPGQEPE